MAITIKRKSSVTMSRVDRNCVLVDLSNVPVAQRTAALQRTVSNLAAANPGKRIYHSLPVTVDGATAQVYLWLERVQSAPSAERGSGLGRGCLTDPAGFGGWLADYLAGREWPSTDRRSTLSRPVLLRSLALGKAFLIRNQLPAGNFVYQYDFVEGSIDQDDNQVRQAGALWSMALLLQHEADAELQGALERGLEFFAKHTIDSKRGGKMLAYPGATSCSTGGVALVALAIIDYLRAHKMGHAPVSDARAAELRSQLSSYLGHLIGMRLRSGHFAREVDLAKGTLNKRPSPYADGEVLLCLVKAARYLGYGALLPVIQGSLIPLATYYTQAAWKDDKDSDLTKGFFQWSCMALREYHDAGWDGAELAGDYIIAMGWWMVHTHRMLERKRNTAYAIEGLIQGIAIANNRGEVNIASHFSDVVDQVLYRMTSWQVGGPLQDQNRYLTDLSSDDERARGGVMNHRRRSVLRIDVTQHQMHAVVLALSHLYPT